MQSEPTRQPNKKTARAIWMNTFCITVLAFMYVCLSSEFRVSGQVIGSPLEASNSFVE